MATYSVEIKADEVSFRALISALRHEADGAALRRDLAKKWRAPAAAAAKAAQASIRSVAGDRSHHAVSLRDAIAAGVKAHVRTRGPRPGVSVEWHRSPSAKRMQQRGTARPVLWRSGWLLNEGKRWKHYAWGRPTNKTVGVLQAAGWFDNAVNPYRPAMLAAVRSAYRDLVDRIGQRSRG